MRHRERAARLTPCVSRPASPAPRRPGPRRGPRRSGRGRRSPPRGPARPAASARRRRGLRPRARPPPACAGTPRARGPTRSGCARRSAGCGSSRRCSRRRRVPLCGPTKIAPAWCTRCEGLLGLGDHQLEVLGRVGVHERERGLERVGLDRRTTPLSAGSRRLDRGEHVRHRSTRAPTAIPARARPARADPARRLGRRGGVGDDDELGRARPATRSRPRRRAAAWPPRRRRSPGRRPCRRRGMRRRSEGEGRHRLGAADRVDLLDAQQGADGQRAGVRKPGRAGRRAGGDLGHARDLRRHDRHHGARRIRGEAAGDVDADPAHRHLPGRDDLAVAQRHPGRPRHLVGRDGAEVLGQELEGGAHVRVEVVERLAHDAAARRAARSMSTPSRRDVSRRTASSPPSLTMSTMSATGASARPRAGSLDGRSARTELADLRRRDASALPHRREA